MKNFLSISTSVSIFLWNEETKKGEKNLRSLKIAETNLYDICTVKPRYYSLGTINFAPFQKGLKREGGGWGYKVRNKSEVHSTRIAVGINLHDLIL